MNQNRIEQLKQLAESDPSEITYYGLGRALMDAGHPEEAIQAFQRAIELKPDYTASYLMLGECLQGVGRVHEAIQVYERGLRVAEHTRDEIPRTKMRKRLKRLRGALGLPAGGEKPSG